MGMMDAYEYDYDKVDDIIEELHDRVRAPSRVNLTSLLNRGKVRVRIMRYRVAGIRVFLLVVKCSYHSATFEKIMYWNCWSRE